MDSPAEYRRKMNKPWADPRAGMAFINRDHKDMLKGLQELLSEPVITDDLEREFEYWVGYQYEEHLDDSGQRNFCKDTNLGDNICTKVMDGYVIHYKID